MVDAWTQTSNHGSDNEGHDHHKEIHNKEERSLSMNKNIDLNSYPMSLEENPLSFLNNK